MNASVSLWSADQLDLGRAVDALDGLVEGFHMDIMDGHFVSELVFGVDAVRAVAERARATPVDVHLMLEDAEAWIAPFAAAGADLLTVHPQSCADPAAVLAAIEALGVRPGVAVTLDLAVDDVAPLLEQVDRVLLMGTEIGIKGVDLSERTVPRIQRLVALRDATARRPEIYVDGGIREHTVPALARAGADGVAPGSLVFGREDWLEGVRFVHDQAAVAR